MSKQPPLCTSQLLSYVLRSIDLLLALTQVLSSPECETYGWQSQLNRAPPASSPTKWQCLQQQSNMLGQVSSSNLHSIMVSKCFLLRQRRSSAASNYSARPDRGCCWSDRSSICSSPLAAAYLLHPVLAICSFVSSRVMVRLDEDADWVNCGPTEL